MGFGVEDLRKLGVTVSQLKNVGFVTWELKDAGVPAKELKSAGFNAMLHDLGLLELVAVARQDSGSLGRFDPRPLRCVDGAAPGRGRLDAGRGDTHAEAVAHAPHQVQALVAPVGRTLNPPPCRQRNPRTPETRCGDATSKSSH